MLHAICLFSTDDIDDEEMILISSIDGEVLYQDPLFKDSLRTK